MPRNKENLNCPGCGKAVQPEDKDGVPVCPECGVPLAVGRAKPGRRSIEDLIENAGPYEVKGEIARGGMGVVYRVLDRSLKREVAVKVLLSGPGAADEDLRRFYREAQSAARLRHSNIVSIHAVGEVGGQPYIVMDYIDGENLADLIDAGAVTPRRALDITEQVAGALHYAHLRGVVHRDIKPGNILIDNLGQAQLMDFGLAKRLDERMQLTRTGTTVGTPTYMPPEQAEGHLEEVDAQSDVYSVGAVLYEMLTGQPPFAGENTMAILMKVLEEDPVPPRRINPRIHRDVENICLKAMEKSKARRYASALEMAEDIRRLKRGEAILARSRGAVRKSWDYFQRRLPLTAALVSALVAALLTAGYFYVQERGRQTARMTHIQQQARDRVRKGRELLEINAPEEALAAFEEARRLMPDLPGLAGVLSDAEQAVLERKIRRYLDRAERCMRDEQFEAAEVVYGLVLEEFDPENEEAVAGLKAAKGMGTLSVIVAPPDVEISLVPLLEDGRRGQIRELGRAPVEEVEVEMGVYCLALGPPGSPYQEVPFSVERRENVSLEVTLPPAGTPINMVSVNKEDTTLFYIDRFEYPNRWGSVPLSGVPYLEAAALCRKAGKRLCGLEEWRQACTGGRAQSFPYGLRFRPDACNTGRPVEGGAAPTGSFAGCVSPFGVYDMSGNVAEWVDGSGKPTTAGGNWSQSLDRNLSCHSARYYEPSIGWESVGFRCCLDASAVEAVSAVSGE